MKTRNTITKLLAITMALAAIAVIGSSWMAQRAGAAGRSDINDTYVFRGIIGITSQQSLRVSVGNNANSIGDPIDYTVTVTNSGGVPLYHSDWKYVPVRRFSCLDVSREDLSTEGEPETGRAEVMVTVTMRVPAGSNPEHYIGSLELINEETGGTVAVIEIKRFKETVEPTS